MAKVQVYKSGTSDCIVLHCPGCGSLHTLTGWNYNGDANAPTLSPDVVIYSPRSERVSGESVQMFRCHFVLSRGQLIYLSDSTHKLAGRIIDMPDIEQP